MMAPYAMKYLEHMRFDKLIVYDNQSSDNTVELLKKYNFVEVRTLNTGGEKSNQKITDIKNSVWKEFKDEENAWMFVSDFDEVIYYDGDLKEYLEEKSEEGYNYLNQDMIETVCEHFPNKERYVHEDCDGGYFWGNTNEGGCKMTLFKLDTFSKINYIAGAHRVTVTLNSNKVLKSLNDLEIKSFHLKNIDFEYCLSRKNLANKRRGRDDRRRGYGKQYEINDADFKKRWLQNKKRFVPVEDYINGKIKGGNAISLINTEKKIPSYNIISSIYEDPILMQIRTIKPKKIIRRI